MRVDYADLKGIYANRETESAREIASQRERERDASDKCQAVVQCSVQVMRTTQFSVSCQLASEGSLNYC